MSGINKFIVKKNQKLFSQIIKFLLIGVFNTAIDLVVLNALILMFDPGKNTALYTVFKSISFLVAVINSYYFNKYWTFRSKTRSRSSFISFFVVSVVGFILNVITATLVFDLFTKTYPDHVHLIANIGALFGTGIVLIWNFIGYKFFVFKD